MNKFTIIVTALASVLASGTAAAEVIYNDTSVSVGYRFEVSDASEKSNLFNRTTLELTHRSGYDWGELFTKYRIENLGETANEAGLGGDDWTNNKFFVNLYYKLGEKGTQVWFDMFTVSNHAMVETDLILGIAQKAKIGQLKLKFSVGAEYAMGHNKYFIGNEKQGYEDGYNGIATRINASYNLIKNIKLFAIWDHRWGRDMDIQQIMGRDEENGYIAVVGGLYKYNDSISLSIAYAHQESWGGYNENGDNINVNLSYHF